jgi:hypothetical protein
LKVKAQDSGLRRNDGLQKPGRKPRLLPFFKNREPIAMAAAMAMVFPLRRLTADFASTEVTR